MVTRINSERQASHIMHLYETLVRNRAVIKFRLTLATVFRTSISHCVMSLCLAFRVRLHVAIWSRVGLSVAV